MSLVYGATVYVYELWNLQHPDKKIFPKGVREESDGEESDGEESDRGESEDSDGEKSEDSDGEESEDSDGEESKESINENNKKLCIEFVHKLTQDDKHNKHNKQDDKQDDKSEFNPLIWKVKEFPFEGDVTEWKVVVGPKEDVPMTKRDIFDMIEKTDWILAKVSKKFPEFDKFVKNLEFYIA